MFGGSSNSNSPASKSDIDSKSDGKSPSPDSSPNIAAATPFQRPVQPAEKRSGNGSPPTRQDIPGAVEKKRRSSSVGSKASSLLASARNSFNFSQVSRSNSEGGTPSPLHKMGKQDPALAVPQGQHNNSAGESQPGPKSTFRVGVWEDRNKKCRRTMEDTHAFLYNFLDTPPPAIDGAGGKEKHCMDEKEAAKQEVSESDNGYFAIFDGHAGSFAADWCGKKVHLILEQNIRKHPNTPIPELLDMTFTSVDAQLEKLPLRNSGCTAAIAVLRWEERVPSDRSITGSLVIAPAVAGAAAGKVPPPEKDGLPEATSSEAVTAKLKGTAIRQRVLYTANVGDARIILCRSGRALRLSYDHKGSDENEGRRIANAGGLILNNRVNGVLAVTRALGDTYMKDLVTGHPYTTETVLQPDLDQFIIIACDGLWDVCSDQEAVDLVRDMQDPLAASKLLVDYALNRFSTDNLSCMIVRLDNKATSKSQEYGAESDITASKVSEADKIVMDTKEKIAEGTTPALGESASNGGLGYDNASVVEDEEEGEFVPTILDGTVEEEPGAIDEAK